MIGRRRRANDVPVVVGGGCGDGGRGRRRRAALLRPVVRILDQAFDLEHLGHFEQCRQLIVRYVHLALVHVVQDGLHLGMAHVFEDDRRVLARHLGEHRLEVRRARSQHHLVALDRRPALAEKRRVREFLGPEQLHEHVGQVGLMIVPPKAVLLVLLSGDSVQVIVGHCERDGSRRRTLVRLVIKRSPAAAAAAGLRTTDVCRFQKKSMKKTKM